MDFAAYWPAYRCSTIAGYAIAWIDGVSLAKVKEGLAVFSCTAHGRKKA